MGSFNINGLYLGEMQPDAVVAGCVEIYENVWPEPEETISVIENLCSDSNSDIFWQRSSTVGHGKFQNFRTNKILELTELSELTGNQALQNIHNQFYTLLLASTNSYGARFAIDDPFWHEQYHVLKYGPGEEYKAHYDGSTSLGRCLSAIAYLNDDYEGGELEFVNFKVKIKPRAGMLVIFPSNYAYRHIAHPVKSGTKYALVTWIKDRQKSEIAG